MIKISRNNRTSKSELLVDETIFSLANGFIGTRGSFTEGYGFDFEYHQTYLNGFYDYYDYFYEENLTGFPQRGQKIVNLLDGTKIEFIVDGTPINIAHCTVLNVTRELDLKKGITKRVIHYKTKNNYEFILREKKLVSQKYKDLIAVNVEVESINFSGEINVKSYLQESIKNEEPTNDPRIHQFTKNLDIDEISIEKQQIACSTTTSDLHVISKIMHNIEFTYTIIDNSLVAEKVMKISPNNHLNLTKFIIHVSDLYYNDPQGRLLDLEKECAFLDFQKLETFQENYYKTFWETSFVDVTSTENINELLNYALFQLDSSGAESPKHNIAAKGLSGEGYEGHYFWDTEIYLIPFFALTNPSKAKNLLLYRYNILDKAKVEAKNLGYTRGVKIPWRTINGEESSPYYPAGSAQFHINSDVSYAVIKYYQITNDFEFMRDYGFEILIETARFLSEATNYYDGFYHLQGVTGPDEYTTIVDDNYYTNSLLKYHFEYIFQFYKKYKSELVHQLMKLDVTEEEINQLNTIAKQIYLPFNKELNIYAQDNSFLSKKKLQLDKIPDDMFPLLLHYHPTYLYKHQVLKQADAILGMVLLDDVETDVYKNSFEYYEPITTHDSSLSKCIYSIAAYQLNKVEMADRYFLEVLKTDYFNNHKNTQHGLHIANLGGSYLVLVYGILGLKIYDEYLSLTPVTSKIIQKVDLKIKYHGKTIQIRLDESLRIETKETVKFRINGKHIVVKDSYQEVL
jgi:alpha,alpha-trehalose phosphorylase